MKTVLCCSTLALLLVGSTALAGGRDPAKRPFARAAVDACASLSQGAACTMTMGDRTLSGTCETHHKADVLFCRPPPESMPHVKAAIDACASLAEGDSCSVTFEDRTLPGTCESHHEEGPLACRPERPERGHGPGKHGPGPR